MASGREEYRRDPRDRQTSINALSHAGFHCEIDSNHPTFLRRNSSKPYTEPHHLNDKVFILDTKYKQVSRFEGDTETVRKVVSDEPKQTDIYQVCEYARKRNVSDVYLLYPMYRYEDPEPYYPIGKSQSDSGDIRIHFIRLPFIFEEDEKRVREELTNVIMSLFQL